MNPVKMQNFATDLKFKILIFNIFWYIKHIYRSNMIAFPVLYGFCTLMGFFTFSSQFKQDSMKLNSPKDVISRAFPRLVKLGTW